MKTGIYRSGRVYYQVELNTKDGGEKMFVVKNAEVANMSQLWSRHNQEVTFRLDENGRAVLLSLGEIKNLDYIETKYSLN